MASPPAVRVARSAEKPTRRVRIAKSPRGLFDDVEPKNSRRLLLAAISAFAAHGYHGTTTREIATIAGLSPAAMYTHYPTKAALFYEISLVGHNYIAMLTRQALDGTDDAREKVARLVRSSVTYHAEEVTLARVVNSEFRGALDKRHLASIKRVRHEISGLVQAVVEEGVATGAFSVSNVHGATVALLRLVDISAWYNPAGEFAPEELAEIYVELALGMLGAAIRT